MQISARGESYRKIEHALSWAKPTPNPYVDNLPKEYVVAETQNQPGDRQRHSDHLWSDVCKKVKDSQRQLSIILDRINDRDGKVTLNFDEENRA